MADRQARPSRSRTKRSPAPPDGLAVTDEPVIDLIFPNRVAPRQRNAEPTLADLERRQGFGPTGSAGLRNRKVARRRVLLGLGTGAVAVAGMGGAAALVGRGIGAMFGAGEPRRPNTAVDGLGAAGLADSPSAAAGIAARAKPLWPTPLDRDPALHLLRRATFGPTLVDVVAMRQMGVDAWLDRQLDPAAIPDEAGDEILALYPTVGLTT
ncbi:MAG: DUF1800 family protein, partial [Micromonosporaceae bacterium]